MSDIILTGKYFSLDKLGNKIPHTRVRRIVKNKYSQQYIDVKKLLDEEKRLEFIKREMEINENKTKLQEQKDIQS